MPDMEIMGYNSIDAVGGITNTNKYCGNCCTGLGTSVRFLRWCALMHGIINLTTYNY